MTIKTMEKNLMQTKQNQQTVRIQSQNHLYTGSVKGINRDILDFQAHDGEHWFDMNQVDNYKVIK